MIMAQEIQNVDYESMVEKYMNEWDGCNLREFCFSEKVNIYRMLKTMKKMGVKKEVILTIVRSALMNSLNVYQYMVYCLKTIRSYKGDLADLLANKWKPSETELMPILA